ncbi:DUF317 domain-containing protein [Streptomyces sp. GZWMJZ-114]|uniref:DUF317 domain-containing protein n=1 Tax=Streptomyces sp. GZWMJZ-114 TaxID=2494734 RepID=UPI0010119F3A|nr:DUF317 domain-containing protein [Streptomyces sp. GZWMJZ-114]
MNSPTHEKTDGDVFVPRHLAGSLTSGDTALAPLLDLGWGIEHDDLGNVYVDAPDRRVRVGFLPEGKDDGLWRINAYKDPFGPPTWGICASDATPTEFVTAVTTVLAAQYERNPDTLFTPTVLGSFESFQPIQQLLDRHWNLDITQLVLRDVYTVVAPDHLAGLDFLPGSLDPEIELTTRGARWECWGGGKNPGSARWYTTATTHTPLPLLTALTRSVSDPAPLPRWRADTHSYIPGLAHLTPIRPPAPTPRDVARAFARRPTTSPASSIPRWTTSSSTARRGPGR